VVWGISPKQWKMVHGIEVFVRFRCRVAASPDPAYKPIGPRKRSAAGQSVI